VQQHRCINTPGSMAAATHSSSPLVNKAAAVHLSVKRLQHPVSGCLKPAAWQQQHRVKQHSRTIPGSLAPASCSDSVSGSLAATSPRLVKQQHGAHQQSISSTPCNITGAARPAVWQQQQAS
jgi:hypothetical protein